MLATVTHNPAWWAGIHCGLGTFGAFDAALVAMLGFGFWRGRRNGMTKELLPMFQWLALVVAGGLGYVWLGGVLLQTGVIHNVLGASIKESTAAALLAYLLIAGLVSLVFTQLKNSFRERLEGSNAFGNSEYYLGMGAGVVRYSCMLVFFLALLNAPVYTLADIHNRQEYNKDTFGGGGVAGYSGDFIPSLDELQAGVFKNSFTGPTLKNNLNLLLINSGGFAIPKATAQKKPVIHFGN